MHTFAARLYFQKLHGDKLKCTISTTVWELTLEFE